MRMDQREWLVRNDPYLGLGNGMVCKDFGKPLNTSKCVNISLSGKLQWVILGVRTLELPPVLDTLISLMLDTPLNIRYIK